MRGVQIRSFNTIFYGLSYLVGNPVIKLFLILIQALVSFTTGLHINTWKFLNRWFLYVDTLADFMLYCLSNNLIQFVK